MLQTCCCCVSLKKGGIIIAWFCIVVFVIAVLLNSYSLFNSEPYVEKQPTKKDQESALKSFKINACVEIVILIFEIIFSGILLVGIHKKRPQLILASVIFSAIISVYEASCLVLMILKAPSGALPFGIIVGVVGIGLAVYFICVIYSLYKEIKMEEERKGERGQVEFQGVSRA